MSLGLTEFVLPRPGGVPSSIKTPIPGPDEASFTKVFGTLLPPAKYVKTVNGKAAYYEMPPPSLGNSMSIPDRVILLHGLPTPALGLLPLARALQASFPNATFVLVDLWGHGLSDTPVVPHEMSLFHLLLDALMDQLEWPSAHLVGYSFGGVLTAGYVASRPSRVQSFTLVAPGGLIRFSALKSEMQAYFRGDDEVAARKGILDWLEGGDLVVPTDWKERVGEGEIVSEAVREWQRREHPGNTASVVAAVRDGGIFDNDSKFVSAVRTGIPSLVVLGELDDICNEKDLKEFGFANIATVMQAGHNVARARVSEVAALISEFWKNLNKTSSR